MNIADLNLGAFAINLLGDGATKHNFSDLHPKFLASVGIIPKEWTVVDYNILPGLYFIGYENGIVLHGDENTMKVYQTKEIKFEDSRVLFDILAKYVLISASDIFKVIAIEWNVMIPFENPARWIRDRFFRLEAIPDDWGQITTSPLIGFMFREDVVISYRFIPEPIWVDYICFIIFYPIMVDLLWPSPPA